MPVEVILPKVDMDMSHARIVRWHVAEGVHVEQGDVLFEIETDKSAMEIEAPGTGVLRNVTGQVDEDIAIGATIAWIYGDGEPMVETLSNVVPEPAAIHDLRATPAARRAAREHSVALDTIQGSGPKGRITVADVSAAQSMRDTSPMLSLPPSDSDMPNDSDTLSLFAGSHYRHQPHSSMRRTIASRLSAAHRDVPTYHLSVDCSLDSLLACRQAGVARSQTQSGEATSSPASTASVLSGKAPSITAYVVKALAMALVEIPQANVTWTSSARLFHEDVDIGVAVALDDGLITPIVRRANTKPLIQIADEIGLLASRARNGELKPEEYTGGVTTVSNLGAYGIDRFTSIINPPQSSIVSVGAGIRRPIVKDDAVQIATIMTTTFAFDHRVIDGALGAQLAACFRHKLEQPSEF